mmetsp:Transcript_5428/g.7558  ORF Transcript_5428/g.7558 Transcript_5428/m.7558 type:complete len:202 (-) Transcript_5428:3411-4016(-)
MLKPLYFSPLSLLPFNRNCSLSSVHCIVSSCPGFVELEWSVPWRVPVIIPEFERIPPRLGRNVRSELGPYNHYGFKRRWTGERVNPNTNTRGHCCHGNRDGLRSYLSRRNGLCIAISGYHIKLHEEEIPMIRNGIAPAISIRSLLLMLVAQSLAMNNLRYPGHSRCRQYLSLEVVAGCAVANFILNLEVGGEIAKFATRFS